MTVCPPSRALTARRLVAAGIMALLLGTACGGSEDGGSGSTGAGAGKTVTISNFEFGPETLQANVGDTITVENKDSAAHTVTAVDMSFDTGRFASGTKTFVVSKPGRFEYVCTVHPYMTHKFIQVAG